MPLRRILPLAVSAVLVIVGAACGGDDATETPTVTPTPTSSPPVTPTPTPTATPTPSPTPVPLTPEFAGRLALAGLLTTADLPEADWTVEDVDHTGATGGGLASSAANLFGATPECAEFVTVTEQISGGATGPLADQERTFDAGAGRLLMRSVSSGVTVPEESTDLDDTFETLRALFDTENLRPCLEAGVTANIERDQDVSVSRIDVYTPETVIEGGVAIGVNVGAIAVILPLQISLEIHLWPQGPAIGSLIVMEMNSDLIARNMDSILENAQQRLAGAVQTTD